MFLKNGRHIVLHLWHGKCFLEILFLCLSAQERHSSEMVLWHGGVVLWTKWCYGIHNLSFLKWVVLFPREWLSRQLSLLQWGDWFLATSFLYLLPQKNILHQFIFSFSKECQSMWTSLFGNDRVAYILCRIVTVFIDRLSNHADAGFFTFVATYMWTVLRTCCFALG